MPDIDLGDGLTEFRFGGLRVGGPLSFRIDLVDWVSWYGKEANKNPDYFALLDAARARLKAETGVDLNATQADAFLHAAMQQWSDLKKKQQDTRMLPSSTTSTPSP